MVIVRRVWKWGVATGRISVENYQALCTVSPPRPGSARPRRLVEPVPIAAVEKTLPFLRSPVAAKVRVQLHAGARPSEVCNMRVSDVFQGGVVHIPGAGELDVTAAGVWVVVPGQHKTVL